MTGQTRAGKRVDSTVWRVVRWVVSMVAWMVAHWVRERVVRWVVGLVPWWVAMKVVG